MKAKGKNISIADAGLTILRGSDHYGIMKKTSGLKRAMDVVPKSDLERLSTGALLARLKRLRWCEDSSDWSDLDKKEIASVDNKILFKSDPRWHQAYSDLKAILKSREHLTNKP